MAAAPARFGLPEVKRFVYPFGGATIKLVQQIGDVNARDLLLTARMIGADEAQRIGLVNRVVPAPEVMASALETAEVIAANRPSAVQAVKHQVSATLAEHARSREALEQELGDRVHARAHFREGVEAFRTKRQPRYDSAGVAPLGLLDPSLQRLHLDACLVHRSRVRHGGRSGGIDQVDSKFPPVHPLRQVTGAARAE